MAQADQKTSILLSGGVDQQQADELFGAVVQQGAAPPLKVSLNTRLSVKKGVCVRAPECSIPAAGQLTAARESFGVVSDGRLEKTIVYRAPDAGNYVLASDGMSEDGSGLLVDSLQEGRQSAYFPLHIDDAGAIPGCESASQVATTGQWFAWIRSDNFGGALQLWVCCVIDGVLIVPPTQLPEADFSPSTVKVGLTAHDETAAVWWTEEPEDPETDGVLPVVWYSVLSVNGNQVAYETPVEAAIGQHADWDVAPLDSGYAVLAGADESVQDDGALYQYELATGGRTLVATFANAVQVGGDSYAAVTHTPSVGVAVAYSSTDANSTTYCFYTYNVLLAELTPAYAADSIGSTSGRVAVQFLVAPDAGLSHLVLGVEIHSGSWSDVTLVSGITQQYVQFFTVSTESSGETSCETMYFNSLQNRGGQVVTDNGTYPLFFLAKTYSSDSETTMPGEDDYVDDPAVVGYLFGPSYGTPIAMGSPVLRFGSVRGVMAPAYTPITTMAGGALSNGIGTMLVPYRKQSFGTENLYGRYVKISYEARQPAVAIDKDGAALVAAGLPVQWDGVETVEIGGPLHAPKLKVVLDATGGIIPPAGVYSLVAHYQWTDAAGLVHRSRPSQIKTVTANGTTERIGALVTRPDSLKNSGFPWAAVDVLLYATDTDGLTYHLVDTAPVYTSDYAKWDGIGQSLSGGDQFVNTSNPTIYSTGTAGEELTPQPPPPLRDICIVGSRCWGVDAEIPTRLVYSKLRISGVGFEFFPAGDVLLPSEAGNILAIREMAGTLAVFTERAVFQVADSGPNNTGTGGTFGPAYKISDVGSLYRLAVQTTPAGIVFLTTTGRFCMLAGGAVTQLPGIELTTGVLTPDQVSGCFVLDDADEAVFVVEDEAKVYNFATQRWTTWELPTTPSIVAQSNTSRNVALLYEPTEGAIRRLESDSLSTTANMRWETDWILLNGDFQDHVLIRQVILSAYALTPCGVTLEVYTNYDSTASTSLSWSAAEITALLAGGTRFSVRIEPRQQPTRAVKFAVIEAADATEEPTVRHGMRPISLTLIHAFESMNYEEAFGPNAFKG